MRYHRFVTVLHKPIALRFGCEEQDLNPIESGSVLLEVDLSDRTITIPNDARGVYDLGSFMDCADSIRITEDAYRTGILNQELSSHMDVKVLGWFFRYVYLFLVKAGYFNGEELK